MSDVDRRSDVDGRSDVDERSNVVRIPVMSRSRRRKKENKLPIKLVNSIKTIIDCNIDNQIYKLESLITTYEKKKTELTESKIVDRFLNMWKNNIEKLNSERENQYDKQLKQIQKLYNTNPSSYDKLFEILYKEGGKKQSKKQSPKPLTLTPILDKSKKEPKQYEKHQVYSVPDKKTQYVVLSLAQYKKLTKN